MRKDVAEKWVAALRSGKYKQGQNALCNVVPHVESEETTELFCCLGVLCDILQHDPDFIEANPNYGSHIVEHGHMGYLNYGLGDHDDSYEMLPWSVQSWVGMMTNDGTVVVNDPDTDDLVVAGGTFDITNNELRLQLAHLNDCGVDFEDIANVIEKHVEAL